MTWAVVVVPAWIGLLIHAYLIGATESRRRAVLIGIACFLIGLGLGVMV